jgi:CDP-diacylglycerol--serine O-phosphatidyltransferase
MLYNKRNDDLSSPTGGQGAMKQIPNVFTLLNLIFGCIAIVLILQTGEAIVQLDDTGASQVFLPEKIWWGALFIYAAAIVDFFDGFLARLFKASSEMGKQLDSLSDVVSFGIAPGMILYQLLRVGYAQGDNGLDVSTIALLPAFIYSAAVAWRLAKFNISTTQTDSFMGVPSPATGLLIASFPLIVWYQYFEIQTFFINPLILYALIAIISYLLVCNRRFMAFKFKDFSFKNNILKYALLVIGVLSIFLLKWLAVPLIFILYLIISIFSKEQGVAEKHLTTETKEITV